MEAKEKSPAPKPGKSLDNQVAQRYIKFIRKWYTYILIRLLGYSHSIALWAVSERGKDGN